MTTKPDFSGLPIGVKHDTGKLRYDLIPVEVLEALAEVYTYGAAKYGAHTWAGVEPHRYQAALLRHLIEWQKGRALDTESGLHHLKHALWNAGALLCLAERDEP